MIVPEHALIWYYQWANSFLCCHYYFLTFNLWSSYGRHINCYCPACKKTNKCGWWVGNCHVSWSKGQLLKKICQDIQSGAWGSQRLGSDCHDSSSLWKFPHTLFFFLGQVYRLWDPESPCVFWTGRLAMRWGRIGRIERAFYPLWIPWYGINLCMFSLAYICYIIRNNRNRRLWKFEFNQIIKHKRCTCWVLYVICAMLWIVIMDLLTWFTPGQKIFFYLLA